MPNQSIAVIIPIFNVTQFLHQTLGSITQQSHPAKEIIIIDDGSEPAAQAHIHKICEDYSAYPITLLRQAENKGAAAARKKGIMHATADLLVLMDADDVMCPGSLEHFAHFMETHPELIACYAQERRIDKHGSFIDDAPSPPDDLMVGGKELLHALLDGIYLMRNGGNICIRTAGLQKMEINNEHLAVGEDWVMWCHMALNGAIMPTNARVVLHRRKHDANISAKAQNDASLPFATIAAIYEHPAFIKALGEERMQDLHASAKNALHAYYASLYARNCEKEKAAYHFSKVQRHMPAPKGWQQDS